MNRRHRFLIAVAAAGLLLAGCGGKDSAAPKGDVTASAPAVGTAVDAGFVADIAAAQAKARSSHITMKAGVSGQQLGVVGDLIGGRTASDTKMVMTMDAPGLGKAEVRLLGTTLYVNAGPLTENKFIKVDLLDRTNPLAVQFGSLATQLDPAKQMGDFAKALVSIKKKGTAVELDGVMAQPYVIVVDTAKLAATAGASLPAQVSYTMFIGPDNLPRRIVSEVEGNNLSMDYSKWGQKVHIVAPGASEITPSAGLNLPGAAATG